MNNITIEFCAEDRERLDRLIAALEAKTAHVINDAPKTTVVDPDQLTPDDVQQKLADTLAQFEEKSDDEPPAPTTPVVTEDDIRSMARVLIEKGKKPQLKEIVNKYAPSITDIPEESMPAVYEQLKKLAGV